VKSDKIKNGVYYKVKEGEILFQCEICKEFSDRGNYKINSEYTKFAFRCSKCNDVKFGEIEYSFDAKYLGRPPVYDVKYNIKCTECEKDIHNDIAFAKSINDDIKIICAECKSKK
jgi:Zn finger protein HypA/HybF involved in hydrogenase expression